MGFLAVLYYTFYHVAGILRPPLGGVVIWVCSLGDLGGREGGEGGGEGGRE